MILKERGALSGGLSNEAKVDQQGQRKAVRIVLHEFGSLDWAEHVSVTVCVHRLLVVNRFSRLSTLQHIHRFLHSLRSLIRDSTASVFISLPTHLAHEAPVARNQKGKSPAYEPLLTPEGWVKSLGWASDACIEFQGFAGERDGLFVYDCQLIPFDNGRPIIERCLPAQPRSRSNPFAANDAYSAPTSAETLIPPRPRSRINGPK